MKLFPFIFIALACLSVTTGCKRHATVDSQAAMQRACIGNLLQIEAAKQEWALEHGKRATDTPTPDDLTPYLKGNAMLKCPAGGTYTLNASGVNPQCSIPGHELKRP